MTILKSEWIVRPKKVNAFTGVGALLEIGEDHVCIVCANEQVLRKILDEYFPSAEVCEDHNLKLSIIQAKP